MHSILGQALILLAVATAGFGAVAGWRAGRTGCRRSRTAAQHASYGFATATWLANVTMVSALLRHDFSVGYVAQVGSLSSPTWVTVVSLWSSLEGSILFWTAIAGLYAAALARASRGRDPRLMGYAMAVTLAVCAFFVVLVAGPADPFTPVSPVPTDGPGPNPLLQNHILMCIHPPMLYMGYVGMMIPFAMALASLLRGELPPAWNKLMRRFALVPWAFLAVGIVLGGWWAYEVLGWGGYWAWDPVENASFMPWLAATGYIHSSIVQERRGQLRTWTLSLLVASFLLTILGTFMTRSGVFNSVHSFTQSAIGPIFLAFLAVCTVISVALLAGRAHLLAAPPERFAPASRETAFLLNNLLLVVFTLTVLVGTAFPLLAEGLQGVKLSVGEPYFNRMAMPICIALVFLMGVGPALPWGRAVGSAVRRRLRLPTLAALVTAAGCVAADLPLGVAVLSFALCAFAAVVTAQELWQPVSARRARRPDESASVTFKAVLRGHRRRTGGYIVHFGVLAMAVGITASQSYRRSTEASLRPGETVTLAPYTFKYVKPVNTQAAHRSSMGAEIELIHKDTSVAHLIPRLNFYPTQREPVGTPAVRTHHQQDVYVSLMAVEDNGERVSLKVFVLPLVHWIWWSLPLFVLGSAIAAWPNRQRVEVSP